MNTSYGSIVELGAANSNLTSKYRRNGKLQSCEPCRKAKLRCDHTLPACGRCVKRRRVDNCIYHPSPLTQKRDKSFDILPSPTGTSRSAFSPTVAQTVELDFAAYEPRTPASQPGGRIHLAPRARAASAPAVALDNQRDSTVRGQPGFLGSTSYSSIFQEDLSSLGFIPSEAHGNKQEETVSIPSEKILRGCKALAFFQDRVLISQFWARYIEINDGCGDSVIAPIMKQWLNDLWIYHGKTLKDQNPEKIQRLSEQIWRNTQAPLVFDGTTSPRHWASLSTGHNLRWEVIGCIAAEIGLCAMYLEPSDHLFQQHKQNRTALARRMHDISETCLNFCKECETQDDCFLWLMQENALLAATIRGAANYTAYQQTGELNSAIIAMGLHETIEPNSRTPFFLAETRKRNRLQVYGQEVALASMLGRPCRLSYRYINLEMPLDINDYELFLEGPQLDEVLAKLDSKGWSTSGKWSRVTYLRANSHSALRREDILDISLGNYTRDEVLERVTQIEQKYQASWSQVPNFLSEARDTPSGNVKRLIQALYTNVVRQGYLANQLLLQRVLIRKTGAQSDELIKYAKLIFSDCMSLTGRHDILKDYQVDYVYLLASHGLRSAAIIAVELLKQEQLPVYPSHPRLNRSETVQDLSVFVARLRAVDPSDGTFNFCEQGRKVISCILDKILAPPPAAQTMQESVQQHDQSLDDIMSGLAATTNNMEFEGLDPPLSLGHDADFMLWLENMEWEKAGPGAAAGGGWTGY